MTTGALCGKLFSDEGSQRVEYATTWRFGFLRRVYPLALLVFDFLLLAGIFAGLIYFRRHGLEGEAFRWGMISRQALIVLAVGTMAPLALIGAYGFSTPTNSSRFVSEHIVVSTLSALGVVAAIYAFIAYGAKVKAARSAVFITVGVFPFVSLAYRYFLGAAKEKRQSRRAVCILGSGGIVESLLELMRSNGWNHDVWIFSDSSTERHREKNVYRVGLAEFKAGKAAINGRQIHHVVLAMDPKELESETYKTLMLAHSHHQHVQSVESFILKNFRCVPVEDIDPSWGFGEGFRINSSFTYNRFKRLCDILVSLAGIIFLSPLFLATALAVRATSKGPILFRQDRTGRHERPFSMMKFRTMIVGAEKLGDYTQERDKRLTSIGGFLRRSRLDELPQLFNVLRGDMSLIGPRAEWTKLTDKYEQEISLYHFRHLVRPGVTGWAQVNYSYGSGVEDTLEKLKYDLYYVRYYSVILDLTIMVKTAYTMLFGKGR